MDASPDHDSQPASLPRKRILFVGGGSAGHMSPGFALADALTAQGVEALFGTPEEERESSWFAGRPVPIGLPASRLPRTLPSKASFPARFLAQVVRARRAIAKLDVGCVVALGGWPCAASAMAASRLRIPLVFVAVDAVPGKVVRWLQRRASRIYVAQEKARAALHVPERVIVTGPIIQTSRFDHVSKPEVFSLEQNRRTLLVTGGSLGATALNRRVIDGLAYAIQARPELRDRIQVIHQVGREDEDTRARYATLGIPHFVSAYLRDDSPSSMGAAYATADLALARAGANTVSELQATSTPTVFVPYPFHADRQQHLNAAPLVQAGAARVIEQEALSPQCFADDVVALLVRPDACARMSAAFTSLGGKKCDVASETALDLIRFLGWGLPSFEAGPDVAVSSASEGGPHVG